MQTTTTPLDTHAMFTQYVTILNRAIGENRHKFPFQQLLSLGEIVIGGKNIGVAVYKTNPNEPHDYFTMRFENGKFDAEHGKKAPDISWKVKEEHLQHVIASPDTYVKNPAKLDLDWLKTRLGIEGGSEP